MISKLMIHADYEGKRSLQKNLLNLLMWVICISSAILLPSYLTRITKESNFIVSIS